MIIEGFDLGLGAEENSCLVPTFDGLHGDLDAGESGADDDRGEPLGTTRQG